jgi:L-amino acid N-acyltransferase YncA
MQGYTVRVIEEELFFSFFNTYKHRVFKGVHAYDLNDVFTKAEHKKINDLDGNTKNFYKLYLGVFDPKNKMVGWSYGKQENSSTFYMVSSAILEEHRGKRLYSALVNKCIEVASKKGFQLIYSRHCATNNAVIIPKLKLGFIISKMEIDDKYGVLIHLHFYTNKLRRKIMDYRAGQSKPNEKIKEIFKI